MFKRFAYWYLGYNWGPDFVYWKRSFWRDVQLKFLDVMEIPIPIIGLLAIIWSAGHYCVYGYSANLIVRLLGFFFPIAIYPFNQMLGIYPNNFKVVFRIRVIACVAAFVLWLKIAF